MRRAAEGTTTTGATSSTALNHLIGMRGAALSLSERSRQVFGEYDARNPAEMEALRIDTLRALETTGAEARARFAAKPPKIKKGKKNRKPKK
tara:strand:+ start:176 stop:451 length:276 start_codon:yes stop_codon:yes gene_type:complete